MMKKSIIPIFIFGLATASLLAKETASFAIQALRDANRPELLAGLAEVKGENGDPYPEEWILLCDDATARGGVRELTVKNHHLIAERTPIEGFSGIGTLPHLDLTRVKLDSRELFNEVKREAIAHHVGFDSANYTLRTDATTGAPLWIVQLYNDKDILVGTLQFSAETGTLVKSL